MKYFNSMMVSTGVTTTDGTVKTSQKLGSNQQTPFMESIP
jgi:hypothetical protein